MSAQVDYQTVLVPRWNINSAQIEVPADLVARSRPSSHSVPIVRIRKRTKRPHVARNVVLAVLASQLAFFGIFVAADYSMEAGQRAGYKLVCATVGFGRYTGVDCHWDRL
jgi:hypothetical protein